ncbi:MAG: zinc-ribbon domain-containing protein, partial [Candidatus Riflebacteria bacterium]|nr:zinc-ribbon domain-containing protein [Candidatus Riflebacteria bacterium]
MALIKCPECGKDISDTTVSCVHCGYRGKAAPVKQDGEGCCV